jgi:AcrR family transcriptional regulator
MICGPCTVKPGTGARRPRPFIWSFLECASRLAPAASLAAPGGAPARQEMMAMTHQSPSGPRARRAAWRWGTSEHARRAVLGAARDLFTVHGFSDVTIADITNRAGVSVGSLYHHFGAKDQLYFSLWQDYGLVHDRASAGAVAEARRAGTTDPVDLLAAGARAVLEHTWAERDLARLFSDDDGPPGFVARKREHRERISRHVDGVLEIPYTTGNKFYAMSLLCVISEGAREVAGARNLRQARVVTDAVIAQSRSLMAGGPAGSSRT